MSARVKAAALLPALIIALSLSGCAPAGAPEASPQAQEALSCTLVISCAPVLEHMDALDPDKTALIPDDGVFLSVEQASFSPGETVFDLTVRALQAQKKHIEFNTSPVYDSVYIEGICNLYEFDCGPLSGWVYTVNGVSPSLSCGQYALEDGDKVEWTFVCDRTEPDGGEAS